ncbi:amidase [Rhizobium sp. Root1204]|uniref:amidase n=1 Tax=Rhizobium sp. Root1204 TaxID=1736428 RepID=UPI00071330A2|nr:amidase [Rhizobium sp. Root1204]KQV36999.1 amidase [Rhizobium sp. Root1204]
MHYSSISSLSAAIRSRAVSPVEITRHMLSRIASLDEIYKSYVCVTADRALSQASLAEKEIMSGRWRGPLHGIPVAYKDIMFTDFAATSAGSRIHDGFQPAYNATVVDRLEAAGTITLGKVKTTERAYATHHPDVTPPENPWSSEHWSGASSSGSGVSVAAGLAFAALGSDTGGSIRFPSAANGVTGLKPTWGRVSRHGVFELAASLDHIGPLARSAEDAGLVLSAIAGMDRNDATSLSATVPDYASEARRSVAGMRIGLPRQYATDGVDGAIVEAWSKAAEVFERLGATLVEIDLRGWKEVAVSWMAICSSETALAHSETYPSRKSEYGDVLAELIETGHRTLATEVAAAHQVRLAFNNHLTSVFSSVDLMLIPATIWRVPSLSRWDELAAGDNADFIRYTGPFDMSGSPTITMPGGFDADGLPIAIQLVGPNLSEGLLVRAGAAFQNATSWHAQHPVSLI